MQICETPKWASDILKTQALKHGMYRKMPPLTFKVSKRGWHGHFQPATSYKCEEIVIYPPSKTKKTDTFTLEGEHILLHEIAHWLVRPKKKVYFYGEKRPKTYWHDKRFYRKVFRLCKEYDISYSNYKSEFWYKPRAANKAFSQIYKVTWL